MYFKLMPEFGDKFAACMVERVREAGGTQQEIDEAAKQAQTLKGLYDDRATNAALTFASSFPIGLAVTMISAVILRNGGEVRREAAMLGWSATPGRRLEAATP